MVVGDRRVEEGDLGWERGIRAVYCKRNQAKTKPNETKPSQTWPSRAIRPTNMTDARIGGEQDPTSIKSQRI